jgi:FdhE protein
MLGLYRRVLALQEPIHRWAVAAFELAAAKPPDLGLDSLPFAELSAPFRTFVGDLAGDALPARLSATAAALTETSEATLAEQLRRTVAQDSLAAGSATLGCEVAQLAFFTRAFLQPLAEALAERDPQQIEGGRSTCPRCGWPPQVAVLRDEPEVLGRRYLVCGLCATWWPFPRTTCAACGESDADKLPLHASASTPHLRVEECATCKAYLKSVDLRRDGFAVPEVDDIASVELDLWCEERGLSKISRNLLGQ